MGTQSIKVVLYDAGAKRIAASSQVAVDIIAKNDGTREQKTEWYDAALDACFGELPADVRADVRAVGISGHQHGFVPLDADGRALYNVKLWNDTSTAEECALITKEAGGDDAVIAEVRNLMLPGFTAPKILWLKRHHPDSFARLRFIMLPHDYLNYKFTGSYRAEYGDSSGTALFNGESRKWSSKICGIIDEKLEKLLPPLINAHEEQGKVTPEAAKRWGISAGIPVSSGGGDNMMSAIGTGCVTEGVVTMSMGTSGTLFGYSDKPMASPKRGLSGFNSSTGGYLPLLCTMNCTVASEETRALFGVDVKAFDALAAKAPAGSDGVVFLPFFNGERTPNLPRGRACILGITAANNSRENIARAALESAVFGMRSGLDAFRDLGFVPAEIRITGGGAKSPVWRQMAADILGVPVKRPESDEAAAMGGAIQALWCLQNAGAAGKPSSIRDLCREHVALREDETAVPDAAGVAAYHKAYANYTAYLEALTPLFI